MVRQSTNSTQEELLGKIELTTPTLAHIFVGDGVQVGLTEKPYLQELTMHTWQTTEANLCWCTDPVPYVGPGREVQRTHVPLLARSH